MAKNLNPIQRAGGAPLLSIAIPTYNRSSELAFSLDRFVDQIVGNYEDQIEIVITDDCSTNETFSVAKDYAARFPFISARQNSSNIGLEKNLINCTKNLNGKYLWIFGDDDFLEFDDSLDHIIARLQEGTHSFFVLNRTRRNKDLSQVLSYNWMKVADNRTRDYLGLRQFCLDWGFISVIGFISVNIFEREKFLRVNYKKYSGTMYTQLGMMVEAFAKERTLLIGRPLICHRTATMYEKRAELGNKETERNFMSDVNLRNATYLSLPMLRTLQELVDSSAINLKDIVSFRENTVINGKLIDFLIGSSCDALELSVPFGHHQWLLARDFSTNCP